jgi:hypothetical protein
MCGAIIISVDTLTSCSDFNVFNERHEDVMDPQIERLKRVMECHCREVIDHDHPLSVEVVGSPENLVFEVDCQPGDEGLSIGAPCRQGTEPYGHKPVPAVLEGEKPLQKPVTPVGLAADGSAMASEGGVHA